MSEDTSQTAFQVTKNTAKVTDANGSLYGTGFFIEVNGLNYCITCHHSIYQLDQIFIENNNSRYVSEWSEELSDMSKDLAFLHVKDCNVQPLKYTREALPELKVYVWGYPIDQHINFPAGKSVEGGFLSRTYIPFVWNKAITKEVKKWNKKPAVRLNVF